MAGVAVEAVGGEVVGSVLDAEDQGVGVEEVGGYGEAWLEDAAIVDLLPGVDAFVTFEAVVEVAVEAEGEAEVVVEGVVEFGAEGEVAGLVERHILDEVVCVHEEEVGVELGAEVAYIVEEEFLLC